MISLWAPPPPPVGYHGVYPQMGALPFPPKPASLQGPPAAPPWRQQVQSSDAAVQSSDAAVRWEAQRTVQSIFEYDFFLSFFLNFPGPRFCLDGSQVHPSIHLCSLLGATERLAPRNVNGSLGEGASDPSRLITHFLFS